MKAFLLILFYGLFIGAFIYRLVLNFGENYGDNIKKIATPHIKTDIFEVILLEDPGIGIFMFTFMFCHLPMYIGAPFLVDSMLSHASLCNWSLFFYLLMISLPIIRMSLYTYVKTVIDDELGRRSGGTGNFGSKEIEICSTGDTYDEQELCFKAYMLNYFTSYKNEILKEHKINMIFSDKKIIDEIRNYGSGNVHTTLGEYDLYTLNVVDQKSLLEYLNINENDCDIVLNEQLKYDILHVDNRDILMICGHNKKLKNEKCYQFLCFAYFDKSMKQESVDEDGTCHYKCDYKVLADYSFKQLMKKIKNYDGEF